MADETTTLDDVGRPFVITKLPSSHQGGPRQMKMAMQDCLALVRKYGRPDFFITFTCNPHWQEMKDAREPGLGNETVPDIVARVFQQKLHELLEDLIQRKVLGKPAAHAYVIEFQKRGLPHAHILIMEPEDKITSADHVDQCIRAYIPDRTSEPELHRIVTTHMMHGVCNTGQHAICHDPKSKTCSKDFPKKFCEATVYSPDQGFPQYRRPANGRVSEIDVRDNSWIVPYNPVLLKKYDAHINVEICSSVKSVSYLYKYIYKGPAAANLEIRQPVDPRIQRDEIMRYLRARWIGSAEACWRMFEFHMGGIKPSVYQLPVHLPDQQTVVLKPGHLPPDIDRLKRTQLTEFFALNEFARAGNVDTYFRDRRIQHTHVPDIQQIMYCDMPDQFIWDPKKRAWAPRQKQTSIGRVFFVSPRIGDLYYLRLMLHHGTGYTGYEDICTVNGTVHRRPNGILNFQAAARHRGLCEDDSELLEALKEVHELDTGAAVRRLFVAILLFNRPTYPLRLFDQASDWLTKDCRYLVKRDFPQIAIQDPQDDVDVALIEIQNRDLALYYIEDLLLKHDGVYTLETFGLPQPSTDFDAQLAQQNSLIREQLSYDINPDEALDKLDQLNPGQRAIADAVLSVVDNGSLTIKIFWLDGPGGTGKTFTENVILDIIRSQRQVALSVAASGIAASLLHGGTTAHSRFKIPLDANETTRCTVPKRGKIAGLIQEVKLIVWDEAPMQSRFDMHAVHKCLRDICLDADDTADTEEPWFAGVVELFPGDFRQTLPIAQGGPTASIAKCLKSAAFWRHVRRFELTENMRLRRPGLDARGRQDIERFAGRLLEIGEGSTIFRDKETGRDLVHWEYGWIPSNKIGDLINRIYGSLGRLSVRPQDVEAAEERRRYLGERAILAVTNNDVAAINRKITNIIQGDLIIRRSFDAARDSEGAAQFPSEYWNAIDQPSLAPHILELKIGMVVMVIRNMDPPRVCNGTRIIVTHISRKTVTGTILSGEYAGQVYHAFPIKMESKDNDNHLPCVFTRFQLPLRPAFAMTINKAQGQSLNVVGLDLQSRPVFAHGQLYTGESRITNETGLHLIGPERPDDISRRLLANCVYKRVFSM